MSIKDALKKVQDSLLENVTLVAVSKTHAADVVMQAYDEGVRIFGENKVQEMCAKAEVMPGDIEWHLIGHLQSNKIKYIAHFVSMIQSVDSMALLEKINAAAVKCGRVIDCLLEVHIASEESKYGLTIDEAREIALSSVIKEMKGVRVRGLMTMASFTDDKEQICREFTAVKNLYEELKECNEDFDTLSMGMSGDYEIAMQCGSTMVRVGSSIFGARDYSVK